MLHKFPSCTFTRIQVDYLDQVRLLPRQLLVPKGIDVKLVARDVILLGSVGGLEIDDGSLVGIKTPDKVNATIDNDARSRMHLDLLLRVNGLVEPALVGLQVTSHGLHRRHPKLFSKLRIGKWGPKMPIHKFSRGFGDQKVPIEGSLMHLRQGIMQSLAEPQCFVDRRIEPV